ncbi:MAG TPA: VCBS repeat-containing protein [Tepidisphaeraceae bacterium]|jgi:hypothetical protein|nr:VCBS repeat-containing protein [Tepidisphaeraceae bacterium]
MSTTTPSACCWGISILLGNGNGTFHAPLTVATLHGADAIAVADMNGDGKPDLVFASDYHTVNVMLGNGNGTFQSERMFLSGLPVGAAVADFNGDSKLDVVAVNEEQPLSVLLGKGDGTLQPQ